MKRFKDTGQKLYQFSYLFLVRCPRCDGRAEVVLKERYDKKQEGTPDEAWPPLFAPRRLVCIHCGYNKDWQGRDVGGNNTEDWYFHQPFWLQTSCCGEVLWAINVEHLDFLEAYVGAGLREANPNSTMASRLPEWMKSAKNRREVLRGIQKLREML